MIVRFFYYIFFFLRLFIRVVQDWRRSPFRKYRYKDHILFLNQCVPKFRIRNFLNIYIIYIIPLSEKFFFFSSISFTLRPLSSISWALSPLMVTYWILYIWYLYMATYFFVSFYSERSNSKWCSWKYWFLTT